jgi:hypothetical protein
LIRPPGLGIASTGAPDQFAVETHSRPLPIARNPRTSNENDRLRWGRDRTTGNESMKARVYITAVAPDEGETVADTFYRSKSHPLALKLAPKNHG